MAIKTLSLAKVKAVAEAIGEPANLVEDNDLKISGIFTLIMPAIKARRTQALEILRYLLEEWHLPAIGHGLALTVSWLGHDQDVIDLFLKQGLTFTQTLETYGGDAPYAEWIRLALEYEATELLGSKWTQTHSLIYCAIKDDGKSINYVQMLLELGADPNGVPNQRPLDAVLRINDLGERFALLGVLGKAGADMSLACEEMQAWFSHYRSIINYFSIAPASS
jgi:hypothetical protein